MITVCAVASFAAIGASSRKAKTEEADAKQSLANPGWPNRTSGNEREIAIKPFRAVIDPASGETKHWGQVIVHRAYDVQLPEVIEHVPIFAIVHEGMHHPRGEKKYDLLEVRAKCIAHRLSIAFDLMDEGGHLHIRRDTDYDLPDELLKWRLTGPYAPTNYPEYHEGSELELYPAIYMDHEKLGVYPRRIMTVYPKDTILFVADEETEDSQGNRTIQPALLEPDELAKYYVALIKAHYLLFHKKSRNIEDYSQLKICRTREGEIFKEICIRAKETAMEASTQFSQEDLKSALARIAMSQRERLVRLATLPPRDWRLPLSR
jgi:hypothetical protein